MKVNYADVHDRLGARRRSRMPPRPTRRAWDWSGRHHHIWQVKPVRAVTQPSSDIRPVELAGVRSGLWSHARQVRTRSETAFLNSQNLFDRPLETFHRGGKARKRTWIESESTSAARSPMSC